MAKQTFTTGQVLTAAQVNSLQSNDFNQTVSVKTANYVLAAADKGTRIEFNTSGSVTCTVNSGLFDAGDTLIIQNRGAGTVTVTAGTATVNTSATLALAQYDAGTLYFVSDSAAIFFNTDAGGGSPLTTKGDIYVYGTSDTRLGVGTDGYTLVADSGETTGLKWAAPGGAGANWSLVNAGGTSLSGTTTTISGISNADKIYVRINSASSASASSRVRIQLNSDTGSNYLVNGLYYEWPTTYDRDNYRGNTDTSTYFELGQMSGDAASILSGYLLLEGCNSSGLKIGTYAGHPNRAGSTTGTFYGQWGGALYSDSATISSVSIISSNGSFDAGTVFVYTSA